MKPLAVVLRPTSIDQIIGQDHITARGMFLGQMVSKKKLQSCILWGPSGTGKTSIVRTLANDCDANFYQLNATQATIKDLRNIISLAHKDNAGGKRTVVFVDEIHRWNKGQQDTMLPVVEDGTIVLFGATTEQPKFAVNSTILSRCIILEVKPLDASSMVRIIKKVREYYKDAGRHIDIDKEAAKTLINRCSGDARKLITVLETAVEILADDDHILIDHINLAMPDKHIMFDARGNEHFDLAHCYQQSIQYSDADAAIYWLAKWIHSGEDPAYICRRMMITAFEDCATNPYAAMTAMSASYAVERTGLPECMIPMALATIEMAKSERNKAAYNAIHEAMNDVIHKQTINVPSDMRAGTSGYIATIDKQYVKGWHRDDA